MILWDHLEFENTDGPWLVMFWLSKGRKATVSAETVLQVVIFSWSRACDVICGCDAGQWAHVPGQPLGPESEQLVHGWTDNPPGPRQLLFFSTFGIVLNNSHELSRSLS